MFNLLQLIPSSISIATQIPLRGIHTEKGESGYLMSTALVNNGSTNNNITFP